MKVKEIMTTKVVSIGPETPFKAVIDHLVRAEVSSLPVVDASGKLVGLVTEADVISKEAYGRRRHRALALLGDVLSGRDHRWVTKAAGLVAADVMTKNVIVCSPEDDVRSVARRVLERGVKRMPVVEAGALAGIVSRHDILAIFDRPDEVITADVERSLANDRNMPDEQRVRFSVKDGIVTLTGDVRYEWDEPIVLSIVRSVPGVIDVISHLHHRERNPRPPTDEWMLGPGDPVAL